MTTHNEHQAMLEISGEITTLRKNADIMSRALRDALDALEDGQAAARSISLPERQTQALVSGMERAKCKIRLGLELTRETWGGKR